MNNLQPFQQKHRETKATLVALAGRIKSALDDFDRDPIANDHRLRWAFSQEGELNRLEAEYQRAHETVAYLASGGSNSQAHPANFLQPTPVIKRSEFDKLPVDQKSFLMRSGVRLVD